MIRRCDLCGKEHEAENLTSQRSTQDRKPRLKKGGYVFHVNAYFEKRGTVTRDILPISICPSCADDLILKLLSPDLLAKLETAIKMAKESICKT